MRPKLKISNLISLQDARSSAAVGFDLISFSLERGSNQKLSVPLAWNIIQWISGPAITIELNAASLPELEEARSTFKVDYVTLPMADWQVDLAGQIPPTLLRTDTQSDPDEISALIRATQDQGQEVYFELSVKDVEALAPFADLMGHCLLHFPNLDQAESFIQDSQWIPWGISLHEEALEEPGVLDYERIDQFLEVFNERFEEE